MKTNHPLHYQTIIAFLYLHEYIQKNNHFQLSHTLYALVITINLSINICNDILAQLCIHYFNNIWTKSFNISLVNFNNPSPKQHILTKHTYTKFVETHQDIIHPKNSIHRNFTTTSTSKKHHQPKLHSKKNSLFYKINQQPNHEDVLEI